LRDLAYSILEAADKVPEEIVAEAMQTAKQEISNELEEGSSERFAQYCAAIGLLKFQRNPSQRAIELVEKAVTDPEVLESTVEIAKRYLNKLNS